jgi:hypothetical protein
MQNIRPLAEVKLDNLRPLPLTHLPNETGIAKIAERGDIADIAKREDIAISAITGLPVPWGCDYEQWVLTVRQYCPLGPHGRANLERLIKRARQKDDARELKEFYEGAATYVSRRKSAEFLGFLR